MQQKMSINSINRFEIQMFIGEGAFGKVYSAQDLKNNEIVAIKYPEISDETIISIFRELTILMLVKEHPNCVRLLNINTLYDKNHIKKIGFVLEKSDCDLNSIIKSNSIKEVTLAHSQFILAQLIDAITFLHALNIIHRDLKPKNILVKADCTIKICDFGLSRIIQPRESVDEKILLSNYVVTRFYRAPELFLEQEYDYKIDMWSIGCIFAELFLDQYLLPGKDRAEMMRLILGLLGKNLIGNYKVLHITKNLVENIDKILPLYDKNAESDVFCWESESECSKESLKDTELSEELIYQRFDEYLPPKGDFDRKFKSLLEQAPNAFDLLKKLLKFNPDERISAIDACEHPFIKGYTRNLKKLDIDSPNKELSNFEKNLLKLYEESEKINSSNEDTTELTKLLSKALNLSQRKKMLMQSNAYGPEFFKSKKQRKDDNANNNQVWVTHDIKKIAN